jgi:hypothetical protein
MKYGINNVMEEVLENGSISGFLDENSKASIEMKKLSSMFTMDKDQYEHIYNQNLLKEKSETLI